MWLEEAAIDSANDEKKRQKYDLFREESDGECTQNTAVQKQFSLIFSTLQELY